MSKIKEGDKVILTKDSEWGNHKVGDVLTVRDADFHAGRNYAGHRFRVADENGNDISNDLVNAGVCVLYQGVRPGDRVRVGPSATFHLEGRDHPTGAGDGEVFVVHRIDEDGDCCDALDLIAVSPKHLTVLPPETAGGHKVVLDESLGPSKMVLVQEGALKFDSDKPDLTLVSYHGMAAIARAMMYGVGKYGRDNYRKDPRLGRVRLLAAALRHIALACVPGKELDDDSGLPHTYHAAAALCMLHDEEETS
jgi:hypothetical protein